MSGEAVISEPAILIKSSGHVGPQAVRLCGNEAAHTKEHQNKYGEAMYKLVSLPNISICDLQASIWSSAIRQQTSPGTISLLKLPPDESHVKRLAVKPL